MASVTCFQPNKKLMKKLAEGSESSNILVGSVSFLESPLFVLVRLKEALCLSDLTEVSIPTRYIPPGTVFPKCLYSKTGLSFPKHDSPKDN